MRKAVYGMLLIGLIFFVMGCGETDESPDPKVSYEANVAPILAAKCAVSGCHVAPSDNYKPPHDLDFTTYESFIIGGDEGSIFIAGDADKSEIIEEIVEGKMPPPGSGIPPVTPNELQVIKDWINEQ